MTRVAINGLGRIGRNFLRASLDNEVMADDAQRVVDASLEFAQAGTDPSPDDALRYAYAPISATKAPTGAERRNR
jgi:hypothetical protein